ncbi:MAG: hypothetical protein PHW53_02520 [Patescibacteria group bacterium]|nr:hypothetical protein [Patescibacteria group bacterium]
MIQDTQKRQVTRKPVAHIVKQRPPAVRLYRRIAISFLILTILLLALVAYLSFSSAHIKIFTAAETASAEFVADIVKVASAPNQVEGRIVERIFEKSKEFTPSGEGKTTPAKAGGEVTIINKYNKDQALIATTRLQATDGKIFRIDKSVVVPAGGEIKATAHADKEGAEYEIGPSHFIIPGLWEGLRDKIYAESASPMTGGTVTLKVVSADDLTRAESELASEILEQVKADLISENADPRFSKPVFSIETLEKVSDTIPGQEADKFTIKLKVKVIAVFYNAEQMDGVMASKLEEAMDSDHTLGDIMEDSIIFTIGRYDSSTGIVNLAVSAFGEARLKENSRLLDKRKITGLGVDDAKKYLMSSPSIENVEISSSPFWLKRVPNLEDHIEYEIIYGGTE